MTVDTRETDHTTVLQLESDEIRCARNLQTHVFTLPLSELSPERSVRENRRLLLYDNSTGISMYADVFASPKRRPEIVGTGDSLTITTMNGYESQPGAGDGYVAVIAEIADGLQPKKSSASLWHQISLDPLLRLPSSVEVPSDVAFSMLSKDFAESPTMYNVVHSADESIREALKVSASLGDYHPHLALEIALKDLGVEYLNYRTFHRNSVLEELAYKYQKVWREEFMNGIFSLQIIVIPKASQVARLDSAVYPGQEHRVVALGGITSLADIPYYWPEKFPDFGGNTTSKEMKYIHDILRRIRNFDANGPIDAFANAIKERFGDEGVKFLDEWQYKAKVLKIYSALTFDEDPSGQDRLRALSHTEEQTMIVPVGKGFDIGFSTDGGVHPTSKHQVEVSTAKAFAHQLARVQYKGPQEALNYLKTHGTDGYHDDDALLGRLHIMV